MGPAGRRSCLVFALVLLVVTAHASLACAGAADRLERFSALTNGRLAGVLSGDDAGGADTLREIYGLLDDEIVDSLASGGVFASVPFLQDRLDAFSEAWGATVVRVMRAGPLTVGAFELSQAPVGNSVRVYGRLSDDAALLATLTREGRPVVFPMDAAGGAAQFLVVWEGPPSAQGSQVLRVELVRQHGDGVRVVWSSATAYPDGLEVRRWSVRGSEVRVQYDMRYPGWTPGCDGQTEQEDVYRMTPDRTSFVRVARRQTNAWHRDFHVSVGKLFSAIHAGDRHALSGLVPDPTLRSRLPRSLRAEPACDAAEGAAPPDRVSVAATADRGPWQVTWERHGRDWRVVHAAPVE